jgi:hypothetical protein
VIASYVSGLAWLLVAGVATFVVCVFVALLGLLTGELLRLVFRGGRQ